MARPASQAQLQSLLSAVATSGGGLAFDGSTPPITVSSTIVVNLRDVGEDGVCINFNGLRLHSAITNGTTPLIRFVCQGFVHRFLSLSQLMVYGGGSDTAGCGNGIEVRQQRWTNCLRDLQGA
jgi:hypothetical protein